MAETKNLCAQIPLELHAKVCGEREQREQTTSQYITELLMEYYKMKENAGKTTMRTMAAGRWPSKSRRNCSSGSSSTWSARAPAVAAR